MQYDLLADKAEVVAGDGRGVPQDAPSLRGGDGVWRHRRPVYGEDGSWLYYVSVGKHLMRVDFRTKRAERLPFPDAIAALTVKDGHLVYAREGTKGEADRLQIVRVRLDAPDDSRSQIIYATRRALGKYFVSPSRRFIVASLYAGYGVRMRLVDVENAMSYEAGGLFAGQAFLPCSTVWQRRRAGRPDN